MSSKRILVVFISTFIIFYMVLKLLPEKAINKSEVENSANEMITISETTIEAADQNEQAEVAKREAEEYAKTKNNAENLIKQYISEDNTGKAKDMFNQYSYLDLDEQLMVDADMREFELVEKAICEAESVYFDGCNIEEAKALLDDCKGFVGNYSKKLNAYSNLLDDYNSIDITKLKMVERGDEYPRVSSGIDDNFGNIYDSAFTLKADAYAFDGIYGIYYIQDMDVNYMTATVAPSKTLFIDTKDYYITISSRDEAGNESILYKSDALTKTSLPKDIQVEIPEGTPFLKISCTQGGWASGPSGSGILGNPVLSKKITESEWREVGESLLL